jgi:membrane protease YdiL (CAAX protease family)
MPFMHAADRDGLAVVLFFVLACTFSWSYWIPLALSGSSVERGDGWPTQLPGLLGPMLAAFAVVALTDGRPGVRDLLGSMARWPRGVRAQLATGAPVVFVALALVISLAVGNAPAASDFLRYSGTNATAMVLVAALVITGFGEETGWRGYALARLQPRHGPVRATLLVTAGWAIWHVPLFFLLASYAEFGPLMAVGWLIGLAAGAFVLTAVFNVTAGSVLAVAIWHATYNAGAGTDAGDGLVAPVMTACVIFWAVSLVQRHRSGLPAFGCPPQISRTA